MNLLPSPEIVVLAALLSITVVASVVVFVTRNLRSAAQRQAVVLVGLATVVVAPLLVVFVPSPIGGQFYPESLPASALTRQPQASTYLRAEGHGMAPGTPTSADSIANAVVAAVQSTDPAPRDSVWPPVAVGIALLWLVWVLIRVSVAVRGILTVGGLLRTSKEVPTSVIAEIAEAARSTGLRNVPLGRISELTTPFVIGALQPRIVLPEGFAGWPFAMRRASLMHECGHLVERHPQHGVLRVIADIVVGWHPLVRMMDDALADAQEEIADAYVLRDGTHPASYARNLVDLAERTSTVSLPAYGLTLHRSTFERRIRRLLAKENDMNPFLSTRARLSVALFGSLLLSVPVCLAASPQSPSDASYCPLDPGRTFVHRHTSGEKVTEAKQTVLGMVPVEGGQAAESEFRSDGKVVDYSYLIVAEDGLYQHAKVYIGPVRGVRETKPTVCLLPFPVKVGTVREYEDEMMVQTSGGEMSEEDKARLRYKVRIEIEAIDDVVDVPAGRFLCARVVSRQTFHDGKERITTSWWAPHIGLVKTSDNKELVAFGFTPPATGETKDRILAHALEELGLEGATTHWCNSRVLGSLRSQFARVDAKPEPRLMRVFGDTARGFDVHQSEDWQMLVADEGLNFGGGGAASLFPMQLAGVAAVLAGFQQSPGTVFTGYGQSTTRQEGRARKQTEVTVTGGGHTIIGVVTIEGDALTSVQIQRSR